MQNTKNFADISEIISFIQAKLADYPAQEQNHPDFIKSAVLMLIIPTENSFEFVMEVRSSKLKHHRGEISFPGGRFDKDLDGNLEDTAIRETFEEIGISREQITILGLLDDVPVFTGYIIHPIVGVLSTTESYEFHIEEDEVAELIQVPIDFLLQENIFQEMYIEAYGLRHTALSVDFIEATTGKHYNVWGASCHLLAMFLKIIYGLIVTEPNYHRPTVEEIAEAKQSYNEKGMTN